MPTPELMRHEAERAELPRDLGDAALEKTITATSENEVAGFMKDSAEVKRRLKELNAADTSSLLSSFDERARVLLNELRASIREINDGTPHDRHETMANAETDYPLPSDDESVDPLGDTVAASSDAEHRRAAERYLSSAPVIPKGAGNMPRFEETQDSDEAAE